MTDRVRATSLFVGPQHGVLSNAIVHHDGGTITEIADADAPVAGPRTLVIPALVNAHDHARPIASSFGTTNMPLETWLLRSALGTPPEPYLAAASALARCARAGCGAMMIHYTRPSGTMPMIDEARAIARAASDVGIRIAFALAARDRNPLVYGDHTAMLSELSDADRRVIEPMFVRSALPPREYVALVGEIAAATSGPLVDVQLGPAGVQWCSRSLLETVAENSALHGRRVHMHLLETVYQRAWADREFPQGVVRYLADIGLLSERLTLAHCIHARPEELDLVAASGTRIVTNFSSNLHLHSGLGPIADAHKRGCAVAVGVDGIALDEDDDAIREMRLVEMMHNGLGFDRTWTRPEFLALAVRNGRAAVGAPADGSLAPGMAADMTVLDLDRLDRDALMPVDPLDLLFGRGNSSHVREVIVAGRTIVRDGVPTGVDLPVIEDELRSRYRASISMYSEFLGAWPALEAATARWFRGNLGCG